MVYRAYLGVQLCALALGALCCMNENEPGEKSSGSGMTTFFLQVKLPLRESERIGGEERCLFLPSPTRMYLSIPGWTPEQANRQKEISSKFASAYERALEIYKAIEDNDFDSYREKSIWVEQGERELEFSPLDNYYEFVQFYWNDVVKSIALQGMSAVFQVEELYLFELHGRIRATDAKSAIYIVVWVDADNAAWNVLGEYSAPIALPINALFHAAGDWVIAPPFQDYSRIIVASNPTLEEEIELWLDCHCPNERCDLEPAIVLYDEAVEALSNCMNDEQWNAESYFAFLSTLSGDEITTISNMRYDNSYFKTMERGDLPGWKAWLGRMKRGFPPFPQLIVDCGEGLLIILASEGQDVGGGISGRLMRKSGKEWKFVNLTLRSYWDEFIALREVQLQLEHVIRSKCL